MQVFREPIEFEWDSGNRDKNFVRHGITDGESEEVFFDHRKKILHDILHSGHEPRYVLIGKTKKGRRLFVVFTLRKYRVRVISARDLNRKEHPLYEEKT